MFADRLVLSELQTKVQIISVYYNTLFSVPQQHTDSNNYYLQPTCPLVSKNLPVIQVAGCTVVTLDNLFIVTGPVWVQEVSYGTRLGRCYSDWDIGRDPIYRGSIPGRGKN
jgi:hypothetical protein